jgi:hypothetical protein
MIRTLSASLLKFEQAVKVNDASVRVTNTVSKLGVLE